MINSFTPMQAHAAERYFEKSQILFDKQNRVIKELHRELTRYRQREFSTGKLPTLSHTAKRIKTKRLANAWTRWIYFAARVMMSENREQQNSMSENENVNKVLSSSSTQRPRQNQSETALLKIHTLTLIRAVSRMRHRFLFSAFNKLQNEVAIFKMKECHRQEKVKLKQNTIAELRRQTEKQLDEAASSQKHLQKAYLQLEQDIDRLKSRHFDKETELQEEVRMYKTFLKKEKIEMKLTADKQRQMAKQLDEMRNMIEERDRQLAELREKLAQESSSLSAKSHEAMLLSTSVDKNLEIALELQKTVESKELENDELEKKVNQLKEESSAAKIEIARLCNLLKQEGVEFMQEKEHYLLQRRHSAFRRIVMQLRRSQMSRAWRSWREHCLTVQVTEEIENGITTQRELLSRKDAHYASRIAQLEAAHRDMLSKKDAAHRDMLSKKDAAHEELQSKLASLDEEIEKERNRMRLVCFRRCLARFRKKSLFVGFATLREMLHSKRYIDVLSGAAKSRHELIERHNSYIKKLKNSKSEELARIANLHEDEIIEAQHRYEDEIIEAQKRSRRFALITITRRMKNNAIGVAWSTWCDEIKHQKFEALRITDKRRYQAVNSRLQNELRMSEIASKRALGNISSDFEVELMKKDSNLKIITDKIEQEKISRRRATFRRLILRIIKSKQSIGMQKWKEHLVLVKTRWHAEHLLQKQRLELNATNSRLSRKVAKAQNQLELVRHQMRNEVARERNKLEIACEKHSKILERVKSENERIVQITETRELSLRNALFNRCIRHLMNLLKSKAFSTWREESYRRRLWQENKKRRDHLQVHVKKETVLRKKIRALENTQKGFMLLQIMRRLRWHRESIAFRSWKDDVSHQQVKEAFREQENRMNEELRKQENRIQNLKSHAKKEIAEKQYLLRQSSLRRILRRLQDHHTWAAFSTWLKECHRRILQRNYEDKKSKVRQLVAEMDKKKLEHDKIERAWEKTEASMAEKYSVTLANQEAKNEDLQNIFEETVAKNVEEHENALEANRVGYEKARKEWEAAEFEMQQQHEKIVAWHTTNHEKLRRDFEANEQRAIAAYEEVIKTNEINTEKLRRGWETNEVNIANAHERVVAMHIANHDKLRRDFEITTEKTAAAHTDAIEANEAYYENLREKWKNSEASLVKNHAKAVEEYEEKHKQLHKDFKKKYGNQADKHLKELADKEQELKNIEIEMQDTYAKAIAQHKSALESAHRTFKKKYGKQADEHLKVLAGKEEELKNIEIEMQDTYAKAIAQHKSALESAHRTFKKKYGKQADEHLKVLAGKEEELKNIEIEMQDTYAKAIAQHKSALESAHRTFKKKYDEQANEHLAVIAGKKEEWNFSESTMKAAHTKAVARHKAEYHKLKEEHNKAINMHETALEALSVEHESKHESTLLEWKSSDIKLKAVHANAVTKHKNALESAVAMHNESLQKYADLEEHVGKTKKKHQMEMTRFEKLLQDTKLAHTEKITKYEQHMEKLKMKHLADVSLRDENHRKKLSKSLQELASSYQEELERFHQVVAEKDAKSSAAFAKEKKDALHRVESQFERRFEALKEIEVERKKDIADWQKRGEVLQQRLWNASREEAALENNHRLTNQERESMHRDNVLKIEALESELQQWIEREKQLKADAERYRENATLHSSTEEKLKKALMSNEELILELEKVTQAKEEGLSTVANLKRRVNDLFTQIKTKDDELAIMSRKIDEGSERSAGEIFHIKALAERHEAASNAWKKAAEKARQETNKKKSAEAKLREEKIISLEKEVHDLQSVQSEMSQFQARSKELEKLLEEAKNREKELQMSKQKAVNIAAELKRRVGDLFEELKLERQEKENMAKQLENHGLLEGEKISKLQKQAEHHRKTSKMWKMAATKAQADVTEGALHQAKEAEKKILALQEQVNALKLAQIESTSKHTVLAAQHDSIVQHASGLEKSLHKEQNRYQDLQKKVNEHENVITAEIERRIAVEEAHGETKQSLQESEESQARSVETIKMLKARVAELFEQVRSKEADMIKLKDSMSLHSLKASEDIEYIRLQLSHHQKASEKWKKVAAKTKASHQQALHEKTNDYLSKIEKLEADVLEKEMNLRRLESQLQEAGHVVAKNKLHIIDLRDQLDESLDRVEVLELELQKRKSPVENEMEKNVSRRSRGKKIEEGKGEGGKGMTMKEDVRDQIDECLDRVEVLELKLQKRKSPVEKLEKHHRYPNREEKKEKNVSRRSRGKRIEEENGEGEKVMTGEEKVPMHHPFTKFLTAIDNPFVEISTPLIIALFASFVALYVVSVSNEASTSLHIT
eukprot:g3048.t1